jgi:23S rRNA maturation-related 3'-5' exoribonuclease YhaM
MVFTIRVGWKPTTSRARTNCYKFIDGEINSTIIQSEEEHIVNGVKLVSPYFKGENLNRLIHIIASHHKSKEYGSPVEPKSIGALIISDMNNLSSKVGG